MARLRTVALLPWLAVAGACWHGDSPTAAGGAVPFGTVYEARYTGITAGRLQTIATAGQWAEVWREIQAPAGEPEPLPAVDFGRRRLLLAAAGDRPNGCYAIAVRAIERRGPRLEATIVESEPGAGCACTQAITRPVHVVQLERSSEPIVGRFERRTVNCG